MRFGVVSALFNLQCTYKTLFKHGKSSVLIIYKLYIKKNDNEAKHLLKLNTVLPDCRVGVTSIINIQIMF